MRRNGGSRKSFKKSDISKPLNFEHRIHAEITNAGDIRGLPIQWQAFLGSDVTKESRPRPLIDASCITANDVSRIKTIVRGDVGPTSNLLSSCLRPIHSVNTAYDTTLPRNTVFYHEQQPPSTVYLRGNNKLSDEQFRSALSAIVDRGDPRSNLTELIQIGEGSTGVVYSSYMISRKTKVAVKCMNIWKQQRRELLFNEVLATRGLKHPHLVEVFGSYLVSDELWVVMELMDAGSLTNIVTQKRMVLYAAILRVSRARVFSERLSLRLMREKNDSWFHRRFCFRNLSESITPFISFDPHGSHLTVLDKVLAFLGYTRQIFYQHTIGNVLVMDQASVCREGIISSSTELCLTSHSFSGSSATVSVQCLQALALLHARGIIHRDVKSDSILLNTQGVVKISDFGFCGQINSNVPKRRSLLGTPYWFSSQVASRDEYGTDADIWSFGITVLEMIFGEPPYFNDPPQVAMQKIIDLPPPRIPANVRASPELESFVSAMLTKDANKRATALQLLSHTFLLQKAKQPSAILPTLQRLQ